MDFPAWTIFAGSGVRGIDFAYRISLNAWLIAFSISIILIVAFLSIAQQTIKAAVTNPAESLRLE